MFISFFTGKVMLFYGISLIMKEKSNASALEIATILDKTPNNISSVRIHIRKKLGLATSDDLREALLKKTAEGH